MGEHAKCEFTGICACTCHERFNDDMIRRGGLPKDVMGLIHDLCYHHDGRDVQSYVTRAQEILKTAQQSGDTKELTVPQLLEYLRSMPHNASWLATIADIEEIMPKATAAMSSPSVQKTQQL